MAMGNYCYTEGIECPYATSTGDCLDEINDYFGLCEMRGDEMPPKGLSAEERRTIAAKILRGTCDILPGLKSEAS